MLDGSRMYYSISAVLCHLFHLCQKNKNKKIQSPHYQSFTALKQWLLASQFSFERCRHEPPRYANIDTNTYCEGSALPQTNAPVDG